MRGKYNVLILFLIFVFGTTACSDSINQKPEVIEFKGEIPFDMPSITLPVFPDKTFNIVDFGAVNDATTKNTSAFAKAIEACFNAGGGTVLVPKGKWLTGPIHLKSNINFHLNKGAEILFSQNTNDYLPVVLTRWEGNECYNYSPLVYAKDCNNIAITGKGHFNGQGQSWWHMKHSQDDAAQRLYDSEVNGIAVKDRIFGTEKDALRPVLIQLFNCSTVLLEDYTSKNSPFWNNHIVYCKNVVVRNINLENPYDAPNSDGLDIDSSSEIYITGINANVGDDALCIKSGLNEDGWRVNRPSQNIIAEDYHIGNGHGGFVIGSEMSGGVKNILVRNCSYKGTELGIRIKTKRGRGSYVKNIWFQDIEMENIFGEAIRINMFYPASSAASRNNKLAKFSNINFKNITCNGAGIGVLMRGEDEQHINNIHFENVAIKSKVGFEAINVDNSSFNNVNVIPETGPAYAFNNSFNINLSNCKTSDEIETYLNLAGSETSKIIVSGIDKEKITGKIKIGREVDSTALSIR